MPGEEYLAPEDWHLLYDIDITRYTLRKFVGLDPALQKRLLVTLKVIYGVTPQAMPGLVDVALEVTQADSQAQADLTAIKREAEKLTQMLARDSIVDGLVVTMQYRPNADRVKWAFDQAVEGFQGAYPFWSAVYQVMSRPAGQQFLLVREMYVKFAFSQYPMEDTSPSAARAIVVYKSENAASARRRLATGMKQDDLIVEDKMKAAAEKMAEVGLWRGKQRPPPGCVERIAQYLIPYGNREPFELRIPYDDCPASAAAR